MQRRPAEPTELMQRRPAEPTELMTRRQVPWFPIAVATVILGAGAVVLVSRLVPDAAPVVARDAAPVVARDAAPAVAIATPDAAPAVELDAAPVVALDADNEIEMPPIDVERPPPDRPKAPGMFSIDSSPWATIYVDGNSLGITPIVKRSLPAGRHKLRAVLKDGRSKEMSIDIPAGKLAKPIQLTW